jgi:3-oxoacyl-[acyl-carrier protein] reductase
MAKSIDFFNLENKNILVLGASSDIGLSLCENLEKCGANIFAHGSKNFEKLEKSWNPIKFSFSSNSFSEFGEKIPRKIDGFVYLIGKPSFSFLKTLQFDEFNKNRFLNQDLALLLTQQIQENLSENASVIFVGSAVSDLGDVGMLEYGMSKSALEGLVRGLSKVLSHKKIRVNAVSPHLVNTQKNQKIPQKIKENYKNSTLLNRLAEPEEISLPILFLLSKLSSYITGQTLKINGGSYF